MAQVIFSSFWENTKKLYDAEHMTIKPGGPVFEICALSGEETLHRKLINYDADFLAR